MNFKKSAKEIYNITFIAYGTTQWIDIKDKILKNYSNTEIKTIACSPTQASSHVIQSISINKAQRKAEEMENKVNTHTIGNKCRIQEQTTVFDKTVKIVSILKMMKWN